MRHQIGEGHSSHTLLETCTIGSIRIVLVDDHAVVREGTRRILECAKDMQVVGEAADGEEAIRVVAATRPAVVLLDIAMPKMNGVKAIRVIKAVAPTAAVLALSAYDDDAYVFAVLDAGAAGYLLKTARGSELVEAIRAIDRGEAVLSPVVASKLLKRVAGSLQQEALAEQTLLTKREMEVLKAAAEGLSNKDIARSLQLSGRTVQAHLGNVFNKLNVGSRTEAIVCALRRGIISIEDTESSGDRSAAAP